VFPGVRSKEKGRPQLDTWLVEAVTELMGILGEKVSKPSF
jgi:hypothetical protein